MRKATSGQCVFTVLSKWRLILSACGFWTSPFSPVQVEGEDVLLHLLLAHDVVKDRSGPVHRDARVRHSKDPVELGCDERDTRLLDGLSKKLLFHSQVPELQNRLRKVNYLSRLLPTILPSINQDVHVGYRQAKSCSSQC